MLGSKAKCFTLLSAVSLDTLVPTTNFYRKLEAKLDLSFVRELVKDHYSATGRPSIDPIVFFKLQLIMFFEGIRSERQLMQTVNLHLAHRWYIGYDLHERVPDHSSLTKIRQRYGLEVFQRFFEHIVELCIQAGLVWGKELYFDGTKIKANANVDSLVPRFYVRAKQHLETLFSTVQTEAPVLLQDQRGFVQTYNGIRVTARPKHWYKRTADALVSSTDPDAMPMKAFNKAVASLGYHDHYVVDGGKSRIILAALVTPAYITDNMPMLDLQRWVRFRWHVHPKIAVGDTRYGTTANIVGLENDGIRAYVPLSDFSERSEFFLAEDFTYDAEQDRYICPQGQELPLYSRRYTELVFVYRANAQLCNVCPLKSKCTNSRSGRHVFRSFFYAYLDRVRQYHKTEPYKKAFRKRSVWVEPLFGEAKQWHGLRQFRLRGLLNVNIEALIVAAGQNLKRLLTFKHSYNPQKPTVAMVLHRPITLPKDTRQAA